MSVVLIKNDDDDDDDDDDVDLTVRRQELISVVKDQHIHQVHTVVCVADCKIFSPCHLLKVFVLGTCYVQRYC